MTWPRHFIEENCVMAGLMCSKIANLAQAFYREFSFGNVSSFFFSKEKFPNSFSKEKFPNKISNKQV